MDFSGDRIAKDAKLVWQVADLVDRGKLAEGVAIDASLGPSTRTEGPPDNTIAFFRTCLMRSVGKDELNNLLKGVRLPRGYAEPPPDNGDELSDLIGATADACSLGAIDDQ